MATINRKIEALCSLTAFVEFCKSKMSNASEIAKVDAVSEKAQGLSEDFYAAVINSAKYRSAVSAVDQGRAIAQAARGGRRRGSAARAVRAAR